jgi:enolase-phosphatase E1
VLLDIEGTTTPIAFVHETLFGYARARVREFLDQHWDDPAVQADVARLRAEHGAEAATSPAPPPWRDDIAAIVAYLLWLMDRDRKSTGLKSLQGKIWEQGYRTGVLRSEVYPDVPPALARWHAQGLDIAIFSSGSVQAQRTLFAHTVAGDLTPLLCAYFDTTTGPKGSPQSYTTIAAALEHAPAQVLFLSDVTAELDAAHSAGMQTLWCVRGDTGTTSSHAIIRTFDGVFATGR